MSDNEQEQDRSKIEYSRWETVVESRLHRRTITSQVIMLWVQYSPEATVLSIFRWKERIQGDSMIGQPHLSVRLHQQYGAYNLAKPISAHSLRRKEQS